MQDRNSVTDASTRRQFLKGCAAVGAASIVGQAATSPALAIDPVARNGKPKFKFSLAAYSYRSLLQGKNSSMTLSGFIRDCADMDLEGTELTSYYFPNPVTPAYLYQLKQEAFHLGLDVSGTAVGNDFGHPESDPKRKQQIDHVKTWVDHAEKMGAPVIRIFAGHAKKGIAPADSHRLMVSAIEECCDYAGKHGVHLALENHGGPTSTAKGLMKFVRDVKSPWFAVNLDTGNFRDGDAYRQLEEVAPYALNVQIKVAIAGPKGKEPSDLKRLAKILRGVNYRGYIVLEYEERGDPRAESARYLKELREAFA